jgi:lipopolysaccharide transport system ATP-binding protein
MPAIESLCSRAILLEGGRCVRDGGTRELVREYYSRILEPQAVNGDSLVNRPERNHRTALFRNVALLDELGRPTAYLSLGGAFHLRLGLELAQAIDYPVIGIGIDDTHGQRLLTLHTPLSKIAIEHIEGRCAVDCCVKAFPLAPGDYCIKLALTARGQELDVVEQALCFTVTNGDAFGDGRGFQRGLCIAPSEWTVVA